MQKREKSFGSKTGKDNKNGKLTPSKQPKKMEETEDKATLGQVPSQTPTKRSHLGFKTAAKGRRTPTSSPPRKRAFQLKISVPESKPKMTASKRAFKWGKGGNNVRTVILEVKLANVEQNLLLLKWIGLDPAKFGVGSEYSGLGSRAPDSASEESDTIEDMIMNFYDYLVEGNYKKDGAIRQISDTLKISIKTVRKVVNERLKVESDEHASDEQEPEDDSDDE